MRLIETTENVILAVKGTYEDHEGKEVASGWVVFYPGRPEYPSGEHFSDCELLNAPTTPGVYRCKVEFWFQQGYFEGYKEDSESEWEYRVIEAINVMEESDQLKEALRFYADDNHWDTHHCMEVEGVYYCNQGDAGYKARQALRAIGEEVD